MPNYYIHLQAAAETMERLKAGLSAGSPLTRKEADDLFDIAHTNRNYFAAGAYGPDLFVHKFDPACNAEYGTDVRGRARPMKGYLDVCIRQKLSGNRLYRRGVEIDSALVRKPYGHWSHMGILTLHRCKEAVGSLLDISNAILKGHGWRFRYYHPCIALNCQAVSCKAGAGRPNMATDDFLPG